MTYKRNIGRLPIIPADAKVHNVTCHYCIVGCGYKAYTWPINQQGTPTSNWSGQDLAGNSRKRRAPGMRRPCTTSSGRTARM